MTPLTPGTLVELEVERPVAGGRMLARHEGQVVLTAGAIPGERVRARIERAEKGVAFASVETVLVAAASRRDPFCDPQCGGLAYAHVVYDSQPGIKRDVLLDALRRGARLEWERDLPVHPSPEHGHRLRARLHVRGGRAGFFREGTHEICDAGATRQLGDAAMAAVERLVAALPAPVLHGLDSVEVTENLAGDARAVHLSWHRGARVPAWAFGEVRLVDGITGISASEQWSRRTFPLAGVPFVSDPLKALVADVDPRRPEERLRRHASSFFQANRFLLPTLVERVLAWIPHGPVLDLYAGVGLFAVAAAAKGLEPVTAVEGDPASSADLVANARPFGAAFTTVHEPVERFLARARPPAETTVIVDPPRTGMSRQALDAVLAGRFTRLLYVSCDVATLARDLRRAIDTGYHVTHLEAFDLFPNTAHVETLAVLDR